MQEWKAVASAEDAFWTPPPSKRARAPSAAVQCPLVCPAHSCYRRPERNPSRVQPSGRAQGPLKSALPLHAGALAELVVGILSTVRKLESEDRCPNLLPKDRPLALGRGHVTVSIGAAWLVPRD